VRVSFRRRLDKRKRERVTEFRDGVRIHRPSDKVVRERHDGRLATAGLRHRNVRVIANESAQQLGIGGGKCLKDGLIGITDAHPVAVWAGQHGEDLLLELAGILCLILQNEGPAVAKAFEEFRGNRQHVSGQADQIIKVDRPTICQGTLIGTVDLRSHCGEGEWRRLAIQRPLEGLRVRRESLADFTKPAATDSTNSGQSLDSTWRAALSLSPGRT